MCIVHNLKAIKPKLLIEFHINPNTKHSIYAYNRKSSAYRVTSDSLIAISRLIKMKTWNFLRNPMNSNWLCGKCLSTSKSESASNQHRQQANQHRLNGWFHFVQKFNCIKYEYVCALVQLVSLKILINCCMEKHL